jgi:predicted DCC family thiol-disulfide oxidoreductase YuxK
MSAAGPIWLFDGVCVLCSRSVEFFVRHEREPLTRFIAIQSDEGRRLAVAHGIDPDHPDSFLLIEHGRARAKSDGIIALAHHLRDPWRMIAGFRFLPRPVRDWLYDRVARNRYRVFGKREICIVPSSLLRKRFVLPE